MNDYLLFTNDAALFEYINYYKQKKKEIVEILSRKPSFAVAEVKPTDKELLKNYSMAYDYIVPANHRQMRDIREQMDKLEFYIFHTDSVILFTSLISSQGGLIPSKEDKLIVSQFAEMGFDFSVEKKESGDFVPLEYLFSRGGLWCFVSEQNYFFLKQLEYEVEQAAQGQEEKEEYKYVLFTSNGELSEIISQELWTQYDLRDIMNRVDYCILEYENTMKSLSEMLEKQKMYSINHFLTQSECDKITKAKQIKD